MSVTEMKWVYMIAHNLVYMFLTRENTAALVNVKGPVSSITIPDTEFTTIKLWNLPGVIDNYKPYKHGNIYTDGTEYVSKLGSKPNDLHKQSKNKLNRKWFTDILYDDKYSPNQEETQEFGNTRSTEAHAFKVKKSSLLDISNYPGLRPNSIKHASKTEKHIIKNKTNLLNIYGHLQQPKKSNQSTNLISALTLVDELTNLPRNKTEVTDESSGTIQNQSRPVRSVRYPCVRDTFFDYDSEHENVEFNMKSTFESKDVPEKNVQHATMQLMKKTSRDIEEKDISKENKPM